MAVISVRLSLNSSEESQQLAVPYPRLMSSYDEARDRRRGRGHILWAMDITTSTHVQLSIDSSRFSSQSMTFPPGLG